MPSNPGRERFMSDDALRETDHIWKALADETRRGILDFLRAGPRTTTEIVEQFPGLTRFAVMKHLDVLRQAALVLTRDEGRRRLNSLNAVPIHMIYDRWVSRFENLWANTLLGIKESAERAAARSGGAAAKKAAQKLPRKKRRQASAKKSTSSTN
jgi:DNA-binding transcriptional ArsR family regulator